MEEVSVPGEAHKNPTATRIRYPINAVGTAVKCSAATLGTVIVIGVFTDIPYRITHDVIPHVGMVLRQASGPRTGGLLGYNGKWSDPHSAEGRSLRDEVARVHYLPGDAYYWADLVSMNPRNEKPLANGYQKGDMLSIPEPDQHGR